MYKVRVQTLGVSYGEVSSYELGPFKTLNEATEKAERRDRAWIIAPNGDVVAEWSRAGHSWKSVFHA